MDVIKKFTFADNSVLVTIIDSKDLVSEAIALHDLSPLAAAALGRTLTVTAFMANNLKGAGEKLSVTVNGGGPLGRIITAGDAGGKVRGYVENPHVELPFRNGKLDVGGGVGKDGYISVIKDLGLKEPYIGRTALINGEIASDFAYYFTASEQQPSAVALGVLVDKTGCIASGGIFVQPLPGCPDHVLTVLEDIVGNFTAVSNLFKDLGAEGIKDKYFGHFDINELEGGKPEYICRCNRSKLEKVVLSLGRAECDDVIAEQGRIEIGCQFCGKKYIFDKNDVERLFSNK